MLNQFVTVIFCTVGIFAFSTTLFSQSSPSTKNTEASQPTKGTPPCTLELSSIPKFVGVQIGMPYDEIFFIYPEIEKDEHFHKTFDQDGSGLFMFQSNKIADKFAEENAKQISLNFNAYKVQIFSVVYRKNKWTSIEDAVSEFSRVLGVENSSWFVFHKESATLKCTDFKFYASSIDGSGGRMNSMSIHPVIPEPKTK